MNLSSSATTRHHHERFVRGQGKYVDDLVFAGALSVAFVRSTEARAQIIKVTVERAQRCPGVVAVYQAKDLGALNAPLPLLIPHPSIINGKTQCPLAESDVYYIGQAIVMIVAENRYIAEDAAALVDVEYQPLPFVVELSAAGRKGAPRVHADVPDNLAARFTQRSGNLPLAKCTAEHVTTVTVRMDRATAAPIETRAVAANFDDKTGELTVWDTAQAPIAVRNGLAALLDIEEHRVRVIAPDVGGGFGQKLLFFYPDELLVPFAAMQLNRPVNYTEDRQENFLASSQERTQIHALTLYARKNGEILGLYDSIQHDSGAFMPYGIIVAHVSATSIAGPYRIPHLQVDCDVLYTPTMPVTPYRGCGRPHACFALERALDQLASELQLDPITIRKRNLIRDDEFPYRREGLIFQDGAPVELDSGQYLLTLDTLAKAVNLEQFRSEQALCRTQGRYLGLGIACYVEGTGIGPYEGARVKIHPISGNIFVSTGVTCQGQDHQRLFAHIVAEQLGVPQERVIVLGGDTQAFDLGGGTYASRSAVVAGNAVYQAACQVREKIRHSAAQLFGVSVDEIILEDGRVGQRDGQLTMPLAAIATLANPLRYAFNDTAKIATQFVSPNRQGPALAQGQKPGMESRAFFSPSHACWGFGAHAVIVEVDPLTGRTTLLRYLCIHDCGRVINQDTVRGQILGGIAQGIGGALYESLGINEQGEVQNRTFSQFLMPYAADVPAVELLHVETPSPLNPLGVKGVGEAGCIPVSAAIASAIDDALTPLKASPVRHSPMPAHYIYQRITAQ
ncbi:molybdopterin cofactor-binding domain-containing protein [Serratia sp. NPDC078593]|uniref:molybdopterin cofactor-binding domain-containing protein n=1 Tax=unclassified Serratia (in: enterobacteria) TaxID=2647522 RepID=UPI0037D944CB